MCTRPVRQESITGTATPAERCNSRGTCNYVPVNQSERCVWSEKCRGINLLSILSRFSQLLLIHKSTRDTAAIDVIYDIMRTSITDSIIILTRELCPGVLRSVCVREDSQEGGGYNVELCPKGFIQE